MFAEGIWSACGVLHLRIGDTPGEVMTIHHGDCVEVMAAMPEGSIDAIVCDPPYGLGFMGKEWDDASRLASVPPSGQNGDTPLARFRTGKGPAAVAFDGRAFQSWCAQWATAALRVAKPGAYLLAFGGTRTVHRMTVALEDAGWIIRDMLVWAYASGFPKSKALLKPAWEPIVMARKPGPLRDLDIDGCRIGTTNDGAERSNTPGSGRFVVSRSEGAAIGRTNPSEPLDPNIGRWPANVVLTDPVFGEHSRFFWVAKASRSDREPVMPGMLEEGHAGVGIRQAEPGVYLDFVYPTPEGIGGWLREQRISAGLSSKQVAEHFPSRTGGLTGCVANWEGELNRPTPAQWRTLRRVIGFDDRYDEVMTAQREVERADMGDGSGIAGVPRDPTDMRKRAPARRANVHPTVKPIELMRHLVRLVTPAGGTCLDPFGGSGTTALACEAEGRDWVLIERDESYVKIAEARLSGWQRGLGLDVA